MTESVAWALLRARALTGTERLILAILYQRIEADSRRIRVAELARLAGLRSDRSVANVISSLTARGLIECPAVYASDLEFDFGPAAHAKGGV